MGLILVALPYSLTTSRMIPPGKEDLLPPPDVPLALAGTYQGHVQWDSNESVNVTIYDCGTSPACVVSAYPPLAAASGRYGNLSFTLTRGSYYAIVPSNSTLVTVRLTVPDALGALGAGLAVVGGIYLVVWGISWRRSGRERDVWRPAPSVVDPLPWEVPERPKDPSSPPKGTR